MAMGQEAGLPLGPVRVRRASVADVPDMAACRGTDPDVGHADPRMAAYLEGRHHPRQALPPRVAYLAMAEDRTVGYIAGHLTRRFGCQGEVQYLYVVPPCRRGGVASMLLRALALWFVEQGARRICVDVNAESPGAAPFYADQGAEPLRPHWMVWRDVSTVSARPG